MSEHLRDGFPPGEPAATDSGSSTIKLFHATTSRFADGQVLTQPKRNTYYPEAVDLLEASRPDGAPSRTACFCASESAEFAVLHAQAQQRIAGATPVPINLYAVEVPDGYRAPLVLIAHIAEGRQSGLDVTAMVEEYWEPKREWRFFEVFGAQMRILTSVKEAELPRLAAEEMRYTIGETDRAKQMLFECRPLKRTGR